MGQGRVELPTSRLSGVRSNHLSYWPDEEIPDRRQSGLTERMISGRFTRKDRIKLGPSKLNPITNCRKHSSSLANAARASLDRAGLTSRCPFGRSRTKLLRKEVIQPQVPLRLPCYDFTPVTDHSLGTCLPCGLAQPLLEQSTPMV